MIDWKNSPIKDSAIIPIKKKSLTGTEDNNGSDCTGIRTDEKLYKMILQSAALMYVEETSDIALHEEVIIAAEKDQQIQIELNQIEQQDDRKHQDDSEFSRSSRGIFINEYKNNLSTPTVEHSEYDKHLNEFLEFLEGIEREFPQKNDSELDIENNNDVNIMKLEQKILEKVNKSILLNKVCANKYLRHIFSMRSSLI